MTYLQIALLRWPGFIVNGLSGRYAVAHDGEIWLCDTEADAKARALFWNSPVHDLEPCSLPDIPDRRDRDERLWDRRHGL